MRPRKNEKERNKAEKEQHRKKSGTEGEIE